MTPAQFSFHVHLAHRMLPHGERPTALHVRIARLLARWQHPCPSHAKLARAAKCCPKTVYNALTRLRSLGLLGWQHQRYRTRGVWRRLPNRYRFLAAFLFPAQRPPRKNKREILNPESPLGKLSPAAFGSLLERAIAALKQRGSYTGD